VGQDGWLHDKCLNIVVNRVFVDVDRFSLGVASIYIGDGHLVGLDDLLRRGDVEEGGDADLCAEDSLDAHLCVFFVKVFLQLFLCFETQVLLHLSKANPKQRRCSGE